MSADTGKSSGKPGEPSSEPSRGKRTGPDPDPSAAGLVSFTIDTRSGRIVAIERVNSGGERHELTVEEARRLAPEGESTLEDVLQTAFEAGISSVLDEEMADEAEPETEEEAELRRLILRPMIERSAAGRLLHRDVLGRAILGTLIQEAAASQKPAKPTSASKESASPSRPESRGARKPPPRGRTQH